MKMNKACFLCKGACCKDVIIFLGDGGMDLETRDTIRFTKLHGSECPAGTVFHSPCKELVEGKCMIYENRPNVCRKHFVGCPNCLDCIKRYNSDKYDEIVAAFQEEVEIGTSV